MYWAEKFCQTTANFAPSVKKLLLFHRLNGNFTGLQRSSCLPVAQPLVELKTEKLLKNVYPCQFSLNVSFVPNDFVPS